jgi:hypothetical protein
MMTYYQRLQGPDSTGINDKYVCEEYDFPKKDMEIAITNNGVVDRTI